MHRNRYRNASHALVELARELADEGQTVPSRQGEATLELTNVSFTLTHPTERVLTVPGRRAKLPAQIAETAWVLAGRNDIGWLSHYLPRAADFSDDGETWRGGYGPRMRRWGGSPEYRPGTPGAGTDQLAHVVDTLRRDPSSRRAVINLYDPAVDTAPGKDIPCNNWLAFLLRDGRLQLHVATRSNDLWWGWSGINAFEWSVLLEIVADLLGAKPGHLHFSLGSLHLYEKHWERATELEAPVRIGEMGLPRFNLAGGGVPELDALLKEWFAIEHTLRTMPWLDHSETVVRFPEPMLRSWLQVLADWWTTTDTDYLADLRYTPLVWGLEASPGRPPRPRVETLPIPELDIIAAELPVTTEAVNDRQPVQLSQRTGASFAAETAELHAEKHAAYGDSWRKRGELFSILPNIGRKIDRLVVGGATTDETQVDTATDLLVYLVKYWLWLVRGGVPEQDEPMAVEAELRELERRVAPGPWRTPLQGNVEWLAEAYERILELAEKGKPNRDDHVRTMAVVAYRYARELWMEAA